MAYDYRKLKGRIIEMFGTQYEFAAAMGMSERTLTLKLSGRAIFKQTEITAACQLLEISDEEIPVYFFNLIVQ